MFGAGTACLVCPIGRILHKNKTTGEFENLEIPTMESQGNKLDVMQRFYETIVDIQYGKMARPNWIRIVE